MSRIRFGGLKFSRKAVGLIVVLAVLVAAGLLGGYKVASWSDRDKSYDLYTIRATTMDFYHDHKKLPESIEQLGRMQLRGKLQNYELHLEYKEYLEPDEHGVYVKKRVPDEFYYTLCTRFALPGPALGSYGFTDFTRHKLGHECYRMDVFQQGITSAKYSLGDYPEELEAYFKK